MADLLTAARAEIKRLSKGTTTKEAAEVLRRLLTQKSNAQYVVQHDVTKPGTYRVVRVGGSWDGLDFRVETTKYASNGLDVTLVQWH